MDAHSGKEHLEPSRVIVEQQNRRQVDVFCGMRRGARSGCEPGQAVANSR